MMRALAVVGLSGALAVGGCGERPEERAPAAVREFAQALVDRDYARSCSRMSPSGDASLKQTLAGGAATLPIANATNCQERLRMLSARLNEEKLLAGVQAPEAVHLEGDEVRIEYATTTDAYLEEVDGEYRISDPTFLLRWFT